MNLKFKRADRVLTALFGIPYVLMFLLVFIFKFTLESAEEDEAIVFMMMLMGGLGVIYLCAEGIRLSSPLFGLCAGAIIALPVAIIPWIIEDFDSLLLVLGLLTILAPTAAGSAGFSWLAGWLKRQSQVAKETGSQIEQPRGVLVGIGGWLILPAIGFALGPAIWIIGLFIEIDREVPGFIIVCYAVLLAFGCFLTYSFFTKRRWTPVLMFTYLLLAPALLATKTMVYASCRGELKDLVPGIIASCVLSILAACIWIPYFAISKRVQATFVK